MDTAIYMLRTGRQGFASDLQLAFRDLTGSIPKLGLAMTLAWQSIGRQASKDSSMRRQKAKRIGRTR